MNGPRCRSRLGQALLLVGLAMAGHACSDPSGPPVCPQAGGEFASFGCAVLDVTVLGSDGERLPDVTIQFRARRYCGCEFGRKVEGGRFRQTVHLYDPDVPIDTLSVMVYAAATGEQYPQTDSTFVNDSALAVLDFRPIGAPSVVTSVEIRLPLP